MTEKSKSESLERLKNKLEQFKLNLKLASQHNDTCEIKHWTKQVKLTQLLIDRIQGKKP
jgi:hypothetical protein